MLGVIRFIQPSYTIHAVDGVVLSCSFFQLLGRNFTVCFILSALIVVFHAAAFCKEKAILYKS